MSLRKEAVDSNARRLAEDSTRAADIEQRGEYRENGGVCLIKIDEAAKESGS